MAFVIPEAVVEPQPRIQPAVALHKKLVRVRDRRLAVLADAQIVVFKKLRMHPRVRRVEHPVDVIRHLVDRQDVRRKPLDDLRRRTGLRARRDLQLVAVQLADVEVPHPNRRLAHRMRHHGRHNNRHPQSSSTSMHGASPLVFKPNCSPTPGSLDCTAPA